MQGFIQDRHPSSLDQIILTHFLNFCYCWFEQRLQEGLWCVFVIICNSRFESSTAGGEEQNPPFPTYPLPLHSMLMSSCANRAAWTWRFFFILYTMRTRVCRRQRRNVFWLFMIDEVVNWYCAYIRTYIIKLPVCLYTLHKTIELSLCGLAFFSQLALQEAQGMQKNFGFLPKNNNRIVSWMACRSCDTSYFSK